LPLRDVTFTDAFWAPRQEQLRTTTLPHEQHMLRHHLKALDLDYQPGDEPVPHIFWESDLAKWIEAASYALPDENLERLIDDAVARLARAQQPDGYLNVHFTVVEPGKRFTNLRDAHELYCAGHLIEAAVAHHEATGKHSLLDVMRSYADLIADEFGAGGAHDGGYCGHEEIELALVKLTDATGDHRYRALARKFIDERGRQPPYFERENAPRGPDHPARNPEYNQSHRPVREQRVPVGHAVRAMYLYCAMADLSSDDPTLLDTCQQLWDHLVAHRMYITGGIGSSAANEGFTADDDLPDDGYAETCAAIGLVLWAQRMGHLTHEARYVDVLERALYNGVLSGISADGRHFAYVNPLVSDGTIERHEWFECACCPPNIARLIASLGAYAYATTSDELAIDLYAGSTATATLNGTRVTVEQTTDYPFDSAVRIDVTPTAPTTFTLALRIPAWCQGPTLDGTPVEHGYARVTREWHPGDHLDLQLPMPPTTVESNGRTAEMRGPLVYCTEGEATIPYFAWGNNGSAPMRVWT